MAHVAQLKHILGVGSFTQEALAEAFDVSLVSLNAWVNGRAQPRPKALRKINALYIELAVGSPLPADEFFAAFETGDNSPTEYLSSTATERLLAGSGHTDAVQAFRQSQHGRFLNNLRSIVDALPSGTVTDAVALLETAKRHDRHACANALSYPLIAAWGSICMRSVLGAEVDGTTDAHLAHFSAIAAAVAIRTGVPEFRITVPVAQGRISLPGIGRVQLYDDESTAAELVSTNDTITVNTSAQQISLPRNLEQETENWQPIRNIAVSWDGMNLRVALDDVDPYRRHAASRSALATADRLDPLEYKSWKVLLADAWSLLVERHTAYAKDISEGTRVMVPIDRRVLHDTAFYRDGFGALASTLGDSPTWTAQGILEEFQRSKLNAWHNIQTLHTANSASSAYMSPFSEVPLPFACLVEGFYAFAATADFWAERYRSSVGEEQSEAAINYELRNAWQTNLFHRLVDSGELTADGRRMVSNIRDRCERLRDESVSAEVRQFVRIESVDRRLTFRVANIETDRGDVERLAAAWWAGQACPINRDIHQHLRTHLPLQGRKRRRLLQQLRLSHAERFEDLLENEHFLDLVVPGADLADAWTVNGMHDRAIRRYRDSVTADPENWEAWAGLAAACANSGGEWATTLGRIPEMVIGLYRRFAQCDGADIDPLAVAKWLEPLLWRVDDMAFEASATDSR